MEPAISITEFTDGKEDSSILPKDFFNTGEQRLPVAKWRNVSVKLFLGGTPMAEISEMVGQEVEEVKAFIHSSAGQYIIKEQTEDVDSIIESIIRGSKMDGVLEMLRIRDKGSSDGVRLAAIKELRSCEEALDASKGQLPPEQAKAELEKLLKEMLTQPEQ
tara:strand:- start:39741 stop:40223 length:483 start_codon:yes stop_codon:yes gene_type:complete